MTKEEQQNFLTSLSGAIGTHNFLLNPERFSAIQISLIASVLENHFPDFDKEDWMAEIFATGEKWTTLHKTG